MKSRTAFGVMRIMSGASDWDDLGDRLARIKRLISELERARAANLRPYTACSASWTSPKPLSRDGCVFQTFVPVRSDCHVRVKPLPGGQI
jgi:hypothetical protein